MSTRTLYMTNYRKRRSARDVPALAFSIFLAMLFVASLTVAFTSPPANDDYEVLAQFGP